MRANLSQKPGRTLGISLAIILTVVFYTIIPLIQVGFTFYIRERTQLEGVFVGGGADPLGGALGIAAVTNLELLLRAIPAILYVGVAVLAWQGRPQSIRFVMVASTLGLFAWYLLLAYLRVRADQRFEGFSSDGLLDVLRTSYITLAGAVALYTLWYMNRAPARAFYRGYYLEEPD